jgi:hypothetical protein
MYSEKDIARFWAKVDVRGENECWPRRGKPIKGGYTHFWHNGRNVVAHRVALELKLGRPIKEGMKSLHTCDNPPCCNPGHLWEGTPLDNMRDMIAKGRDNFWLRDKHGPDNMRYRLDPETRASIRERYLQGGVSMKALAHAYGISISTVFNIVHNRF